MNPSRRTFTMRPLAQAKGTPHQSTMQQRLMPRFNAMTMAVVFITALVVRTATSYCILFREALVTQPNQSSGGLLPSPLARRLHWLDTQTPYSYPVMPRIRGRSRRGAAWHSEESRRKRKEKSEAAEFRRKRKHNFERAMAIAARRRKTRPRSPPLAYVEEVIPKVGPPSPPRHILFIVPDNWNPSASLGTHSKGQSACTVSDPSEATLEKPYSPCYVEEEAPPEATNKEKGEGNGRGRQRAQDDDEDTSEKQPPAVDWGYIELVYEIRHKLDDQIFRLERLDQRMDMFFTAHSRASTKKQCPTCARTYTFPARWRHSEV